MGGALAWDGDKDAKLKQERGIGLEEIVLAISRGQVLDIVEQAEPGRYAGQRAFVVQGRGYASFVPFLEASEVFCLKTIFPSRKPTWRYLKQGSEE